MTHAPAQGPRLGATYAATQGSLFGHDLRCSGELVHVRDPQHRLGDLIWARPAPPLEEACPTLAGRGRGGGAGGSVTALGEKRTEEGERLPAEKNETGRVEYGPTPLEKFESTV
jgi:hypothetical protein